VKKTPCNYIITFKGDYPNVKCIINQLTHCDWIRNVNWNGQTMNEFALHKPFFGGLENMGKSIHGLIYSNRINHWMPFCMHKILYI
jgi:hypothetical protein